MATTTFDKLAYTEALKAAGVDENQAKAQANALDIALRDTVATKYDIEQLRHDIERLRAEAKADLAASEARLVRIMYTQTFATVALIVALMKLL